MEEAVGTIEIARLSAPTDHRAELAADVRAGLTATPKALPPKYFYDARGSHLFEQITEQPEYYLTRAETEILEARADEILAGCAADELVEIGSGSSKKTRFLIEALHRRGGCRYVPLDVSEDALRGAVEVLARRYPWLEVHGAVGDFERDLADVPRTGRRLVSFLGSTIGNLEVEARVPFLRAVRRLLAEGDSFVLGVDLVKDAATLHAAYNDAAGVTAAFNKNMLRVLNRELGGDLPEDAFEHYAFYDAERSRVEMWLQANRPVRARLRALGLDVEFEQHECVRTELSCKFRRAEVERHLASAGLCLERWFTDANERFALALARVA